MRLRNPIAIRIGFGLLMLVNAAFAGWKYQGLSPDGSYLQGRLSYLPAQEMGRETQVLSLALPSPQIPALKWVSWTDRSGITHREGGSQIGKCRPSWGTPERFRDVYVVSLQELSCEDAIAMEWDIRFAGRVDGARSLPPDEKTPAERLLSNWILNYPESRSFRSQPLPALPKAGTQALANWGAQLPAQRLMVWTQNEAIHVLSYANLKAAGVPVERIQPQYLQMWHAGKQVPVFIRGETDGVFHPEDEIEFMGSHSRGDFSFYSPYTQEAAYVLTWENRQYGLRAPQIAAPVRKSAKAVPSSFQTSWHAEKDRLILRAYSTAEENVTDLGDRVQEDPLNEFWFWERQKTDRDQLTVQFDLPFSPAVSGIEQTDQSRLVVTIQLKGITNEVKADPDHHVRFLLNGKDISLVSGVSNDAIWEGQATMTWTSAPLPLGFLKPGRNDLTLLKVNDLKTSDGKIVEAQDAYLNWIEVRFPARFNAVDGSIRFSNEFADSLGLRLFEIAGFQSDSISLWDVRGRRLQGVDMRAESNGKTLRFADSLLGQVDFMATEFSKRLIPRLELDTLPNLLRPEKGADWICITDRRLFGGALDSLVKQRQAQGLRTFVVQSRHIYQAFGGGTTNPEAIRNFLRYAYEHWPRPAPTYVLLLGETSLWYDKLPELNVPNLVPTRLIDIRGWGVSSNDDYYAKVANADEIPDLLVGRIPVSSPKELGAVVHKILRHEKERDAGEWLNRSLFIGGYEASFSESNRLFHQASLEKGRHSERMDLFPQSPYYRPSKDRKDFFSKLDSAFAFVQFFGHGGGSVWSDAGILTLQSLDKDSLKGAWPIPLISSITCLTGYFEDPYERSLGEELVRRPRNGAAGFYGSSGYISTAAGAIIGDAMGHFALIGGKSTLGAVITQAEWLVRQKTGSAFLPILAEFNLLGDPAMTFQTPRVQSGLTLSPDFIRGKTEVRVRGRTAGIRQGEAVLQFAIQDSIVATVPGKVADFRSEESVVLDKTKGGKMGRASLHAYADTVSEVWVGKLASGDWWVDSVEFVPAEASYGDSVHVRLRIRTPYDTVRFQNGLMLFALGEDQEPIYLNGDQRLLQESDDEFMTTSTPWMIPFPEAGGSPLPKLYVKARIGLQTSGPGSPGPLTVTETSSHRLALKPRPRLSLRPRAATLSLLDTVGIQVHFQNLGPGRATHFRVQVKSLSPDSSAAVVIPVEGELEFGEADSVWVPLSEDWLATSLQISLIPEFSFDALPQALSHDTVFGWHTKRLSPDETWNFDSTGFAVHAAKSNAKAMRLYARPQSVHALPTHLAWPDTAGTHIGYEIHVAEGIRNPRLRLSNGSVLPKQTAAQASGPSVNWHWNPNATASWIRIDTAQSGQSDFIGNGVYALLSNRDVEKPVVSLQSRGQRLWPDDFIPRNTPIDIVLQDGQGIDLYHRLPQFKSHGTGIDSQQLSLEAFGGAPTLARMRFEPREYVAGTDTLEITASDISGNVIRQSFPYRIGNRLAIQNLGSYPNPFADTAVIAYTLTDYCDKVRLQVFSRAGRKVRTLWDKQAVGYREVVWDGKTDAGAEIANGLYFLKVTATSSDRTESRIFKMFKKRRR